jgi:hypothetical protein
MSQSCWSQSCFALGPPPRVLLQLLQSLLCDANFALCLQGSADPAGHRQSVLCKGYESAHNGLETCELLAAWLDGNHNRYNTRHEQQAASAAAYMAPQLLVQQLPEVAAAAAGVAPHEALLGGSELEGQGSDAQCS